MRAHRRERGGGDGGKGGDGAEGCSGSWDGKCVRSAGLYLAFEYFLCRSFFSFDFFFLLGWWVGKGSGVGGGGGNDADMSGKGEARKETIFAGCTAARAATAFTHGTPTQHRSTGRLAP